MAWLSNLLGKDKKAGAWVLTVTDARVTCTTPEGKTQSVTWDQLEEVVLTTLEIGQSTEMALFVLHAGMEGFAFPMGATPDSEADFIRRLAHLPGFNKERTLESFKKAKSKDGDFVLWQRIPRGQFAKISPNKMGNRRPSPAGSGEMA